MSLINPGLKGDTIVEVLLAITIAAFGIGITYATAQHGLDQTITAREHNEALNLIQNQLTQLRLLYLANPTAFNNTYSHTKINHFCLNNSTSFLNNGPGSPSSLSTNLAVKANTGPYDQNCTYNKNGDEVPYYTDIVTTQINGQASTTSDTLYQVFVRWEPIGGSQINQSSIFYRVNGAPGQSLGYALPDSLAKLYAYRGTTNAS